MVGTEKYKGKQPCTKDNSLYQNFPLWVENDLPKMSGYTAIFFPGKNNFLLLVFRRLLAEWYNEKSSVCLCK